METIAAGVRSLSIMVPVGRLMSTWMIATTRKRKQAATGLSGGVKDPRGKLAGNAVTCS
jgi:hypothetical protein